MSENRADVVLVHLRAFRLSAIAPAVLISWARRDPQLRGVSFESLQFDQSEPADLIARAILARGPRLVGFTCYVWNHRANRAVARRLKELAPEVRIILGGPQVAGAAEREIERFAQVDYVCCGEGEETLRQLSRCLFRGDIELGSVPGLAYRDGGQIRRGAEAPLVDLKEASSPYLTGLLDGRGTDYVILETSRGCPFTCSFCDWGPRTMRYIPDARLEAEFAFLGKNTSCIQVTDADLTMHKERGIKIIEMFLRATAGTSCTLGFELNPVFLVPEIIDVIARAPEKFFLACGIQSIREDVLRKVDRTFDRVKIERNMAYLRAAAPRVFFMFSTIYGLPGDDFQGLRESMDWCLRWRPVYMRANHAQVLPGTELEKNAGALGLTFQPDPPHQVLSTDEMSAEDLGEARELAIYFAFLMNLPEIYSELMAAAAKNESPLGYVGVIEAWIAALKAGSIHLPGDETWRSISDRLPSDIADETYLKIRTDRLLAAALSHAARAVAERWRAPARESERRLGGVLGHGASASR